MRQLETIGVFCGSSAGTHPSYQAAAAHLGVELARRRLTLVFGGGNVGLMGCIADAVMAHGGRAIGIMPRHLVARLLRSLSRSRRAGRERRVR